MIVFGIIYTVDVSTGMDLRQFQPPGRIIANVAKYESPLKPVWKITETCPDEARCYFPRGGKHRKYVGCITKKLFGEMIAQFDLNEQIESTMGSLGGPAPDCLMGWGLMPAVSFSCWGDLYRLNAYATPFITKNDGITPVRRQSISGERDWDRLERAMKSVWS